MKKTAISDCHLREATCIHGGRNISPSLKPGQRLSDGYIEKLDEEVDRWAVKKRARSYFSAVSSGGLQEPLRRIDGRVARLREDFFDRPVKGK
jgi:hypothetical protein